MDPEVGASGSLDAPVSAQRIPASAHPALLTAAGDHPRTRAQGGRAAKSTAREGEGAGLAVPKGAGP